MRSNVTKLSAQVCGLCFNDTYYSTVFSGKCCEIVNSFLKIMHFAKKNAAGGASAFRLYKKRWKPDAKDGIIICQTETIRKGACLCPIEPLMNAG